MSSADKWLSVYFHSLTCVVMQTCTIKLKAVCCSSLCIVMFVYSLSLGSTVMLMPGSLSLIKGGLPVVLSSSRIRRTFLAHTFPWARFFSSCWEQAKQKNASFCFKGLWNILFVTLPYQKVHSPCKLLSHFQLPQNTDTVLVFLHVDVQGAKLHMFLHHNVCNSNYIH